MFHPISFFSLKLNMQREGKILCANIVKEKKDKLKEDNSDKDLKQQK